MALAFKKSVSVFYDDDALLLYDPDHSDYEDIDNSYNDIMNSLMWGF